MPTLRTRGRWKRMRKLVHRRTVDYSSTVVRYIQMRTWQRDCEDAPALQHTLAAAVDMLPTVAYPDNAATSFTTKFVHPSTNKVRCSINRVLWTPNGQRLITGSQSGEFTLWNGQSFNFEMILQAHDLAVRSMVWSHNENCMVTGDDGGCINCMGISSRRMGLIWAWRRGLWTWRCRGDKSRSRCGAWWCRSCWGWCIASSRTSSA